MPIVCIMLSLVCVTQTSRQYGEFKEQYSYFTLQFPNQKLQSEAKKSSKKCFILCYFSRIHTLICETMMCAYMKLKICDGTPTSCVHVSDYRLRKKIQLFLGRCQKYRLSFGTLSGCSTVKVQQREARSSPEGVCGSLSSRLETVLRGRL